MHLHVTWPHAHGRWEEEKPRTPKGKEAKGAYAEQTQAVYEDIYEEDAATIGENVRAATEGLRKPATLLLRGINRAAKGGIKEWMVKTYTTPGQHSGNGGKIRNAWVMKVAAKVEGTKFNFFKFTKASGCNKHRYVGESYISSAKILPGSECKSWHGSYNAGRRLWGEHNWCGRPDQAIMWMSHCGSPSYHMLIVNHGYNYPPAYETMVGASHGGGKWSTYDEDGGAFEFFYR